MQFLPIDFRLSTRHSSDETHNLFLLPLCFCAYVQSVSREVLSSVQRSQGQPAGCLSITGNHEDAAGGVVPADQGCVCVDREGDRLTERETNRCLVVS